MQRAFIRGPVTGMLSGAPGFSSAVPSDSPKGGSPCFLPRVRRRKDGFLMVPRSSDRLRTRWPSNPWLHLPPRGAGESQR